MATYISTADGNFTAAASWAQVETGAGALLTTLSGGLTSTTTSYVYCTAFTGTNANVCDGIMLYCSRLNTTGTVSVTLSDDNGVTATREVTVNASDLPTISAWVFFKFTSTLTLDGGTDYRIGVKSSSAANAQFYYTTTTPNWVHALRLTAVAASSPAAGDVLYIAGEYTAVATYTARTITMDSTATTAYGDVYVCPQGKLEYGTTASTNYVLRLAGNLIVYGDGTLNIGKSGSEIPRTSTAVLEFACTTAGQYGLSISGTCNIYGLSRTSGKDIYYCKLNANAAANATSLTVDTDTGWLNGDTIALAPTTRTYTQSEKRTLNADATATGLSISSGLTNARDGVSPTQAEIINLTRNVKIRSTGSAAANATFVNCQSASTCNFYWCEFYYIGANTTGRHGITAATTTGTFNMYYCSVHDMFYYMNISSTSGSNITVRYNGFYNIGTAPASYGVQIAATSGANTFSNNIIVYSLGSSYAVNLADAGGYFDNNVIAGCATPIVLSQSSTIGSFDGNVIHSNNSNGLNLSTGPIGIINTITIWRNAASGIINDSLAAAPLTVNNATIFGNATSSIQLGSASDLSIIGLTSYSETSYATPSGVYFAAPNICSVKLINCELSPAGKTAHAQDLDVTGGTSANVELNNCVLGASTEVRLPSNLSLNSKITSSKHDKTAGAFKTWKTGGLIERDTTVYKTAAPSEKLTPTSASVKLPSGSRIAAVDNGATLTVSVWIRKSASGDGAAYNGNQPRLIVKRNDQVGITADTVLATYTGSTGSWAQITGTTAAATDDGAMEFVVDCDGTAGWVNVDDWSVA